MDNRRHSVTRFMAAGAEQCLDDYYFLRNTYETITVQEAQLNRILRMLEQDEIVLNWHIDTTPIGRARSRSIYNFDRTGNTIVLPGRIAYQRLRDTEEEYLKRRASSQVPVRRTYQRQQRLSQQHDYSPVTNSDEASKTPSASSSRQRALDEYNAELAESEAKRKAKRNQKLSQEDDEASKTPSASSSRQRALDEYNAELAESEAKRKAERNQKSSQEDDDTIKSRENQLASFTVRYEELTSPNKNSNDQDYLGHLVCEWGSPSSSSGLNYYTIERQLGDKEWLPIGEKINKSHNQIELDISSLLSNDNNENVPSRFRVKAYLNNGKTFTSKPTDEMNIALITEQRFIKPDVEILSANSVQLTWTEDENRKATIYEIEKREPKEIEWKKVRKVLRTQGSARIDDLIDTQQCQFRLVPSTSDKLTKSEDESEPDLLTVQNVNEWLSSLRLVPTSSNIVDVDISEEGFKEFDRYKVEYTTIDQLDQWKQVSDITHDVPHLTIDKLKPGADYKFRLTPILHGTTGTNETTSSHLSLVLDVKMPSTRKGRLVKDEIKTSAPPSQFAIHQTDGKTVLIEAIVPTDKPASFEDVFDVYSKKEIADSDWIKVGTLDRDHLNITIKNLEENTGYTFKINNQTSPSSDELNNIVQEFNFETASVKLYDPSLFLEKIHQSLENVVNGVMRAAAGHQTLEDPVNISLNEVIKEIFLDETLVPNEQYGFDTLALSDDLQLFRGPKQMMLQELEINKTGELSQNDGEIIIHNYRQDGREQQPVIVREENGNTRVGNIDGDVIIRNVVTDVLLKNEETCNQLSMNIVGQAFLKRVQGILIVSNFKGIIVVKNVNKL